MPYNFTRNQYAIGESKDYFINLLESHSQRQIAKMYGCSRGLVRYYIQKFGLISPRNSACRNNPCISNSPELGYVSGVVCGDGSVYHTKNSHHYIISLNSIDKEFIELFSIRLALIIGRKKPYSIRRMKKTYWHTKGQSIVLYNYFKKGNYFDCARQYPCEFLQGFFDSEGSISKHKSARAIKDSYYINYTNTNAELLYFVKELLDKLEISCTIHNVSPEGLRSVMGKNCLCKATYRLNILSNSHHKFINLVGTNILRKKEMFKKILSDKPEWNTTLTCPLCQKNITPHKVNQLFCCQLHMHRFHTTMNRHKLTYSETIKYFKKIEK